MSIESTLSTYDNYSVKEEMSTMVWKIQPASANKSVVFYADRKHASEVFDDVIDIVNVDVDNARHINTRNMLEKIMFRYGIVIDSFQHTVDDGSVVFYGTGFKTYRKPASKYARKDYLKERM